MRGFARQEAKGNPIAVLQGPNVDGDTDAQLDFKQQDGGSSFLAIVKWNSNSTSED